MMMPLMLMDDGGLDMKSMFLMTSMMQKDCSHDTNSQMNMMLPLLMDDAGDDSGKYSRINNFLVYFQENCSKLCSCSK